MNGKGSARRPMTISYSALEAAWDTIFHKKPSTDSANAPNGFLPEVSLPSSGSDSLPSSPDSFIPRISDAKHPFG